MKENCILLCTHEVPNIELQFTIARVPKLVLNFTVIGFRCHWTCLFIGCVKGVEN